MELSICFAFTVSHDCGSEEIFKEVGDEFKVEICLLASVMTHELKGNNRW